MMGLRWNAVRIFLRHALPHKNLIALAATALISFSTVSFGTSYAAHARILQTPSFQLSVTTGPATVQPGQTEQLTAIATASQNTIDNLAFAVTLNGNLIKSKSFIGLAFVAGTPLTETFNWTIPRTDAAGTYTVTVNVKKNGNVLATAQTTFNVGVVTVVVNGSCGSASGTTVLLAPTTNLCTAGTASTVAGTGPWKWSCAGLNGGTTAQCAANKTLADTTPPSVPAGLTGTAASSTQINLTWTASTDNVGVTGYQVFRNGTQIGTSTTTSYGDTGLTASTTYSYTVKAFDAAVNVSAASAAVSATTQTTIVNGSCGSANGTTVSTAPAANLCSIGTASTVTGTGPWTWDCAGSAGGTTVQCSANLQATPVNGACGSANGTAVSTAPTTNLCSAGTALALAGTGPWTWSCAGINNGTTAQCSAPVGTSTGIIPANRMTVWNPGLNAVGAFPTVLLSTRHFLLSAEQKTIRPRSRQRWMAALRTRSSS